MIRPQARLTLFLASLLPIQVAAGEPATPQRSLLFTASEYRLLSCARTLAAGTAGASTAPATASLQLGVHLTSLVFVDTNHWEFRLNGRVVRPGEDPPGVKVTAVDAVGATLVRVDPETGERQSRRFRVGEPGRWHTPASPTLSAPAGPGAGECEP